MNTRTAVHKLPPLSLSLVLGAVGCLYGASSFAAATFKIDETKWVSLGGGLRTTFRAEENAAGNGDDYSKDFDLESIRLYLNGQIHEYVKFEFNTEKDGEDIRVLDGIAKFEFQELFNVWGGRMLPPSDRANLDGPYYLVPGRKPIKLQNPSNSIPNN